MDFVRLVILSWLYQQISRNVKFQLVLAEKGSMKMEHAAIAESIVYRLQTIKHAFYLHVKPAI